MSSGSDLIHEEGRDEMRAEIRESLQYWEPTIGLSLPNRLRELRDHLHDIFTFPGSDLTVVENLLIDTADILEEIVEKADD